MTKFELPAEPSYLNVPRSRACRLRAVRSELGWTQADMAEALEMTATYVGLMEHGEAPVSRRTDLAVRYLGSIPYKAMSRAERIRNERVWQKVEAA